MAVDKLVNSTQLDTDLTSVANAIRTKGNTNVSLVFPSGFITAIENISTSSGSLKYETGTFTLSNDIVLNSSTCHLISHGLGEVPDVVIVLPQNIPYEVGGPSRGYAWFNAPVGETQQYLSSSAYSSYPICIQYYVQSSGPPLKTRFNVATSDNYMFRAGTMPTASDFKLFRQASTTTFYAGDYSYFVAKKWW